MSDKEKARVLETMRYCLGHCDNEDETQMVLWVMEKLQEVGQCAIDRNVYLFTR